MKRLWLCAMLLAVLAACSKSAIEETSIPVADTPTLYAEIADESTSRTYLEQAKYMRWHADDEISAFLGNTLNQRYGFDGKMGANSGTFSQVSYQLGTGNPIEEIRAFYPYAALTSFDDISGKVNYIFPKLQQYGEGDTYGQGANPMVATSSSTSDTFLYFRNICGFLKLQLYGDDVTVKAILVKGNQAEKLSGAAVITAEYNADPSVAMADEATEGVVLDCGEGVVLSEDANNPTLFWIAIPPTTFAGGFTITIKGDNGKGHIQSTTKQRIITRNEYLQMPAFAVVCNKEINEEDFQENAQTEQQVVIPNNQIWYSTKNGMAYDITKGGEVDPKTLFGANLLSNIYYPEGYGVITFDGDVTGIAPETFKENTLLTDIKLPNSVEYIGGYAFSRCTSLASCRVGKASIRSDAFFHCSALTEVVMLEGVSSIGDRAFYECSSLSSITIPNSVADFGSGVFNGCSALREATIGNGVKSLYYTFQNCRSLTSITIPDSITELVGTFSNCTSLNSVKLSKNLRSIGNGTFLYCSALASITLPENLAEIGQQAFAKCSLLTTIQIPESVKSIGQNAFNDCAKLTAINIPEGITKIDAFKGCTSLSTIELPNTITEIGSQAFYGCTSLSSISIPEQVIKIGGQAFQGCSALCSITLPKSITTIYDAAFDGCSSLTSVYCLSEVPPTLDGNRGFDNNAENRKIIVPVSNDGSVINAYKSAAGWNEYADDIVENAPANNQIWYTSNDGSVIEPNETDFGANITSNVYNNGIGVITFDGDVTKVGNSAFASKTKLATIQLPESVTEIGVSAFQTCTKLQDIQANNISYIGHNAFADCLELKEIHFLSNVKTIGSRAFKNCRSLSSANIASLTQQLEHSIFSGCKSLKTIHIPEGVVKIGSNAFAGCSSLESIRIPSSLQIVDYSAFYGVNKIQAVYISDIDAFCMIEWGSDSQYRGEYNLYVQEALVKDIRLSDNCNGISACTFANCQNLESVYLAKNIASIGYSAFENCPNLQKVTNDPSIKLKNIGFAAFRNCISLSEFIIPEGVESIQYETFKGCSNLLSVSIPSSLHTIEAGVFKGCSNLSDIHISDIASYCAISCTYNGESYGYPLFCAKNLYLDKVLVTELIIPQGVTAINNAFYAYDQLKSISMPNTVTQITESAFAACLNLESVVIGEGIEIINSGAFRSCKSLQSVYCKSVSPPTLGTGILAYTTNTKIYIPASDDDSVINAYKTADGWIDYADYIYEYEFTE